MGGSQSAAADGEEDAPKEEQAQSSEAQSAETNAAQPPSQPSQARACEAEKSALPAAPCADGADPAVEVGPAKVLGAEAASPEPAHELQNEIAAPDPINTSPAMQPELRQMEEMEEMEDAANQVEAESRSQPEQVPEDDLPEAHAATSADAPEGKNQRSLEQQMSLRPTDDERTEISKKISWILRHGAKTKKVNVNIDDNGWVNVNDLLHSDILGGTTEDKLLAMINESNVQKTRYEMEDDPNGGKRIRAISKSRRTAAARETRERERREREKKREEDAREREARDRETRERERQERDRDPVREPVRDNHRRRDQPGHWDEPWQDGPTYEQQVKDGFLPVYQGSKLVAMARENETVRPGRRTTPHGGKGQGFDPSKGFDGKGADGKGFDGKGFDGKGFDGKGYDMHKGDGKDRKGRGKDDKGKGKFGDDGKGFYGKGDGYKGDGFKAEGHREDKEDDAHAHVEALKDRYRGSRQLRWKACSEQDIIVRVGLGMETDIVGTLLAGSIVAQIGEDKMIKNGIARMFIESIEPTPGIKGWVTRSAEAAGGPVFFKPDEVRPQPRSGKDGGGKSKGSHPQFPGGDRGDKGGKPADGKGKGRRPIGEGEAGAYNRPLQPGL
mmetsp:Transcript_44719/g.100200  ORF Transcript_44719/g.100200 Transcript_44719/m.100200 type:complete len:616 (-) Transcript_44719:76-1923(-)